MKNTQLIPKSISIVFFVAFMVGSGVLVHYAGPPVHTIELSSSGGAFPVSEQDNKETGSFRFETFIHPYATDYGNRTRNEHSNRDNSPSNNPGRNYLELQFNDLNRIDLNQYFTANRSNSLLSGAYFPRRCIQEGMLYAIEKDRAGQLIVDKTYDKFSLCRRQDERPKPGNFPPLITERHVNIVYNSYIDVTDCFNIPQREILPKIMIESGFFTNTLNPTGGDGGIGQFTSAGLTDIQKQYDTQIARVKNSQKPSCQRIFSIPGLIEKGREIPNEYDKRCHLIVAPQNPMRSLIYIALLYRANYNRISTALNSSETQQLMAKAGLSMGSNGTEENNPNALYLNEGQTENLKQMLTILAYNAGSREAVNRFKDWLVYKANNRFPVTAEDFNVRPLFQDAEITFPIFDENKRSSQQLTVRLHRLNGRTFEHLKTFIAHAETSSDQELQKRAQALKALPLWGDLSWHAYHRLNARLGNSYLRALRSAASTLDQIVGIGKCTPDTYFLSL